MMRVMSNAKASSADSSHAAFSADMTVEKKTPRRRSARIVLRIPLLINSADSVGETEWEPVETVMVSLHGGMLRARQNFRVGDTLDIRVRNKERSARARVVWTSSEITPNSVELGFEILDQEGFWDIHFPPDRWSGKTVSEESRGEGPEVRREEGG